MMIQLSESSLGWAQRQASHGGFAGVEEYLEALLRREQYRADPELIIREIAAREGEDSSMVPAAQVEKAKRRLEDLLVEGLESGPSTPMTREDWVELHQIVEAQLPGGKI